MMTGWLVVNGFLQSAKFDELIQLFCEAADRLQVRLQVIRNSECLVKLGNQNDREEESLWEQKDKPDFVIFWDKDILLANYLESMGVPVYNSSDSIAVCDDKRKTHLVLHRAGIPMPQTLLSPMTYNNIGYPDIEFLDQVESALTYPMVIKEAFGSFGEQVYMAQNREQMEQIVQTAGSHELIFQQFIISSRGRDLRLQVVGDRVTGAMYRYSETDFRANITAGGHMRMYQPSDEEIRLAVCAAKAVGCDFAGVDLLFGENGPVVCEVNSNAHFKNLMDCCGINTAEEILHYVVQQSERDRCRG